MRRRSLVTCCLLLAACTDADPGDNLADGVLVLPRVLREVSAIAAVDAETLACIQDEKGTIFLVGLRDGRVHETLPFAGRGDYEGLARVGPGYWVLRSDGLLVELAENSDGGVETLRTFPLDFPEHECEGLAYDARRDVLLIAPKTAPEGKKSERDKRYVYGFDLRRRELLTEPVIELSVRDLVRQADEMGIQVPTRETDKGEVRPDLHLLFSEVAVDPRTDDLWLLSGVDRALLRVDRQGRLAELRFFTEQELPQPEALAFLPDGRLLVASEGVGGPAMVRVVGRD